MNNDDTNHNTKAQHAPWCDRAANVCEDYGDMTIRHVRTLAVAGVSPTAICDPASGALLREELAFATVEVEAWAYAFDGAEPSPPLIMLSLPAREGLSVEATLTVDEVRGLVETLTGVLALVAKTSRED